MYEYEDTREERQRGRERERRADETGGGVRKEGQQSDRYVDEAR